MELTLELRRAIRRAAGARANMPVVVVAGSGQPPAVTGCGWHYRTRGGTRIWHPCSYALTGWSNMVYEHSTLAVEVGDRWIERHLIGGADPRCEYERAGELDGCYYCGGSHSTSDCYL